MTLKPPSTNKGTKIALSSSFKAPSNFGNETPTFCLSDVDPEYCITQCDKNDKAAFADRLRKLSQMTWNQIIQADRHGFGREKIDRNALRRPIPKHISEDVTFIALRFSGNKAMVGYQSGRTFHAIWFDRKFTLYDHG
jgi:hypothetical protein